LKPSDSSAFQRTNWAVAFTPKGGCPLKLLLIANMRALCV